MSRVAPYRNFAAVAAARATQLPAQEKANLQTLVSSQDISSTQPGGIEPQLSADEVKSLLELLQNQPSTSASAGDLSTSELARVKIFEKASPSVVFISTALVQPSRGFGMPVGAGSGFIWDTEGHIVTNYHVVAGRPTGWWARSAQSLPRKVTVKLNNHEEPIEAAVVGHEADKDLAVLKIDPSLLPAPLQPVQVASSSSVRVGQSVLAIGAPFGLDHSLTAGIVSALGRDIDGAGGRPIRDCIQTDAAINPGNSGGPLLDSHGRLIGVNTMIVAPNGSGGNVGIGFAVPSATVQRIVTQIVQHGPNARPSLGVSVLPDGMRAQFARLQGRELKGALIAQIVPGGPAEPLGLAPCAAGARGELRLGDMITGINGTAVEKNEDLLCAVEELDAGEPIVLTLMRGCDPARIEEVVITPVRRQAIMESFAAMENSVRSQSTKANADYRMRRDW